MSGGDTNGRSCEAAPACLIPAASLTTGSPRDDNHVALKARALLQLWVCDEQSAARARMALLLLLRRDAAAGELSQQLGNARVRTHGSRDGRRHRHGWGETG